MTARKPASTATEDVFNAIVRYKMEHGYPPTLTELSEALYMSRSGIYRHLEKLEQQGRIWRDTRKARGIQILTEPGDKSR